VMHPPTPEPSELSITRKKNWKLKLPFAKDICY
jgi:hypothetical protein